MDPAELKASLALKLEKAQLDSIREADERKKSLSAKLFRIVPFRFYLDRELIQISKSGDIILMQQFDRGFSKGFLNSISASLDGTYMSMAKSIDPWNFIGIVTETIDEAGNKDKYVIKAGLLGLELLPLTDVIRMANMKRTPLALRQLKVIRNYIFGDNTAVNRASALKDDKLSQLSLQLKSGSITWSDLVDNRAEASSTKTRSFSESDLLHETGKNIIDKVANVLFQPSEEEATNAVKVFYVLDSEHVGYLTKDQFEKALASLSEKLTKEESDALLASIDTDGNNKISFIEFLSAFAEASTSELSRDFDILELVMAELIGELYIRLGVLKRPSDNENFRSSVFSTKSYQRSNHVPSLRSFFTPFSSAKASSKVLALAGKSSRYHSFVRTLQFSNFFRLSKEKYLAFS